MSQQVIVTATPDGQVTVETVGVKGPACEKLSAAIEAALGDQATNKRKPEYAMRPDLVQPAAASQGAGR